MKKKIQVFLSSTFVDLENERHQLLDSFLKMDLIPAGMESFPATGLQQLEFIRPIIDESDVYILVIGGRYGSLTSDGISYTEAEFNYAKENEKPILCFVHNDPESFPLSKVDPDVESRQKLAAFRSKVSEGRVVNYWSNASELVQKVTASIHRLDQRYVLGWIRPKHPSQIEDASTVTKLRGELFLATSELEYMNEKMKKLGDVLLTNLRNSTLTASQADIDAWIAGAEKNYDDLKPYLKEEIRVAEKDFVMPDTYGAEAISVIVMQGVKATFWNLGHGALLHMADFRIECTHSPRRKTRPQSLPFIQSDLP